MSRPARHPRPGPPRPAGWRPLVGAILAGVVLALVALGARARAEPAGELRVGVARLPDTLDPAAATPGPGLLVSRQLYQGLMEVGEHGDLQPGLAAQWTASRDGLTWTFRLRSDVQFSDGTPLTPDVVVASLARHLVAAGARDPAEPWFAIFRGPRAIVREVRRGEGATVQIELAQPFSPLLSVLAHPALAIVLTQNDSVVPFLGTGPYRVAERGPGRLVLQAAAAAGDPPRAARLVFDEVGDDAGALAELGPRGRLDLYFPQAPPAWGGLGLQTLTAPTWQMGLLAFRTHQGLAARKSVRQAVALALDPALVGPALGQGARPHAAYLPPGAWATRATRVPGHDPIRARRLLAEVRAAGAALTLLVPEPSGELDVGRLAEAIRLSLAVAGLDVQVRQAAGAAYTQALRQGEGELALLEVSSSIDDPHFVLRPLVASDAAVAGSGTNVAFYRSTVADDLLLRASQLAFRPERLRLYQRLQLQLAEDLPYLPLYVRLQWAVARPGLHGLRLDPTGRHRLDRVWVEAAPEPSGPPSALVPGG